MHIRCSYPKQCPVYTQRCSCLQLCITVYGNICKTFARLRKKKKSTLLGVITRASRPKGSSSLQGYLTRLDHVLWPVYLPLCRGGQGKGMVAPLVHLLVSGGPSDQSRAARALSNMATDSYVKEQIVVAGMSLLKVSARSWTQACVCVQRIPLIMLHC